MERPAPEPPPSHRGHFYGLRFNPLVLTQARVSLDVEWLIAPRHALVLSPHVTLSQSRDALAARALGFTNRQSTGFGAEAGYRHYVAGGNEPEGLFLGASLLLDSTKPLPGAARFTAYGGALDVGYQLVWSSGFTLSAGGCVLLITTKGATTEVAPRFLFGIGWTF